ncbi:MAG TPA: hypothetical protein PK677_17295, partial [Acidiphilium sp.]|nr:hypothetical protein [Acidiphilium sp.]
MASIVNTPAQSLTDRLSGILLMLRQILGTHQQSRAIEQTLKWAIWHRLTYFARRFSALAANPPKPPTVIASEAKQSTARASQNT